MKSQGVGAAEIRQGAWHRPGERLPAVGSRPVIPDPGLSWPGNQASFVECGSGETIDALERYQRIRRER
jgi:hypothetical protein